MSHRLRLRSAISPVPDLVRARAWYTEWLGIEPLGLSRGWIDFMTANFAVHDGYTLEVLDGMQWAAAGDLERVLTRRIKQLDNLQVGCEIDIGPVGGNWGSFHKEKNPMGMDMVKAVRADNTELMARLESAWKVAA